MEVTEEHVDRTDEEEAGAAGDGAGATPEQGASQLYDADHPPFDERPAPPPRADREASGPPALAAPPGMPRPAVATVVAAAVALLLLLLRRRRRRRRG